MNGAQPEAGLLRKIRCVLPYILAERRALFLILLGSAGASAMTIAAPWPLKVLVDVALVDPVSESQANWGWISDLDAPLTVLLCGAGTIAIVMLSTLLGNALSWLWTAAGHRMLYALAGDMFSHAQRMSLLDHVRKSAGDLLSRINGDSWCVYSLSVHLLVSPAQQFLTIIGVGLAAIAISPRLTLLIFVLAPAIVLSVKYFGNPIRERARGIREAEAALVGFSQQTLSNIPLVQVFGLARRNARVYDRLGDRLVSASQSHVIANDGYKLVNGLALSGGSALVLYFGMLEVLDENLTVGSLLVFMAYVQSLTGAVNALLSSYGGLKTIEASLDRVIELINSETIIREVPGAPALQLHSAKGPGIEFDGVSFEYETGRPTLRDIDLNIEACETLAIVGPTGAGKSTLAGLIPRFFDPDSGSVRIEGQPLPHVSLESVRSRISIVLQEPFLLPLTIAENIAFGRPTASLDEVMAAAKAANADEFIKKLPDGYQTTLGERGVELSGGQRQRISIARALTRDAPILILDEPTSAVDPDTEATILEATERLMVGRTTLIIAHRMSTIQSADRVGFLEAGRLVELGTPSDLVARKGRFADFSRFQTVGDKGGESI
ncbi:ABC transporter ATP-binding protein [Tateyamaria pelophila]|uniref:ABC transporter ATP-binding protein n=1 Tax=Tateyamaria pelophila TaxID=328415 RepID=UPI001CBE9F4F|nr:ABC transporter ATP-binding protein [Tateyamaria pelophila]